MTPASHSSESAAVGSVHGSRQRLGSGHLSTMQICEHFGISRSTWRNWVLSKQAPQPVPNFPGHPRWTVSDIERFERGKFGSFGRSA